MTNFGLALYNWRMGSGMPQVAAARSLGVSVATLGSCERGKTEPSRKKLQTVAEIIGYDPAATAEVVNTEPEEVTLDLVNLPGANARERMLERDRRLAYMERNREMVAERDAEPEAVEELPVAELDKPVKPYDWKMAHLLGYLEGLAAVPDYAPMMAKPIKMVEEMMEGHYAC